MMPRRPFGFVVCSSRKWGFHDRGREGGCEPPGSPSASIIRVGGRRRRRRRRRPERARAEKIGKNGVNGERNGEEDDGQEAPAAERAHPSLVSESFSRHSVTSLPTIYRLNSFFSLFFFHYFFLSFAILFFSSLSAPSDSSSLSVRRAPFSRVARASFHFDCSVPSPQPRERRGPRSS